MSKVARGIGIVTFVSFFRHGMNVMKFETFISQNHRKPKLTIRGIEFFLLGCFLAFVSFVCLFFRDTPIRTALHNDRLNIIAKPDSHGA